MKTLIRICIRVCAILSLSSIVFAYGEKTFTWQPPIAYEDGAPLPNADIKEYRIYCDGETVTPIHVQPNIPLNTDTWASPENTFMAGTHVCFATTVDNTDIESGPSNTVNFTVPAARPNPPVFVVQ